MKCHTHRHAHTNKCLLLTMILCVDYLFLNREKKQQPRDSVARSNASIQMWKSKVLRKIDIESGQPV